MGAAEAGTLLDLLEPERQRELLALGRSSRYPRGTRLMHEGEPGDRVMVLTEGHVKTTSLSRDGQELVLSFCGPGDILGELSFLHGEKRSSSVTAIEPVEAVVLSSERFRSHLEEDPDLGVTLIDMIGRRFRRADLQRVQFGASDATGRVAARISELADRYGEADGDAIRISLPITQEELGGWAAASRAGVAQALKTMRDLGWIQTERRRITVLDPDALRARIG